MLESEPSVFERVYLNERDEHLLFTIDFYGRKQYLLYHIPTKTVLINQSFKLTPNIIHKMISMGVRVAEDMPQEAAMTIH